MVLQDDDMFLKSKTLVDSLRNDQSVKTWSMKCLHTSNFNNDLPNRQNYTEEGASILAYPLGYRLPKFCSNKCVAISKKAASKIFQTAKDSFRNGLFKFATIGSSPWSLLESKRLSKRRKL